MNETLAVGLQALVTPRSRRELTASVTVPRAADVKPVVEISHVSDLVHDSVLVLTGVALGAAVSSFWWWAHHGSARNY
jgi:hypothetical protein